MIFYLDKMCVLYKQIWAVFGVSMFDFDELQQMGASQLKEVIKLSFCWCSKNIKMKNICIFTDSGYFKTEQEGTDVNLWLFKKGYLS